MRPRSAHTESPNAATARAVVLATLAVTLVLLAFIWPTRLSDAKNLPVDVVGSGAMTQTVAGKLAESGTFDVSTVQTRDEAVTSIEERASYGAIVLPSAPGGNIEVLTASAASPVVSQLLGQVGQQLGEQAGQQAAAMGVPAPAVTITDVVPLTTEDPRGTGLAMAALPLAMGGIIGGALISLQVTGARRRLAAVLGYAVLGGLTLAAVLGPWLGILPEFGASALVIGTALLATGATIVGLHSMLGLPGLSLGAVITMFIGNPLASAASPIEFLPGSWGAIGQYFVPGAAASLLRVENYFPQASTLHGWLVLGVWALAGLVLILIGHAGGRRTDRTEDEQSATSTAQQISV